MEISFLMAFLGLFFLVGFGILGYAAWAIWRSSAAAGWPTTEGTLTKLDLVEKSDSESTSFEVVVEYTYRVTGEEFRGKRLAFGYAASSGREAHDEILHKLKAARAINVRYNPANPAQSTLSYGIHRSIRFLVVFAMTWLFFTAGFAVLMLLSSSADSVLLENLSVH